jgi:hypothetical protein
MFVPNNLVMIAAFAEQSVFAYATNDTKSAVETDGYFDEFADRFRKGDILQVSGDIDGTPFHTSYTLSSVTATDVALTEHAAVTQNVIQEVFLGEISSKASDADVIRYVPTFDGTIDKIYSVLDDALATDDATFTAAINASAVTDGAITAAQSGSAAGDVDVATPSAANTFSAGDVITITGGGGSTATATAKISMKLTPS